MGLITAWQPDEDPLLQRRMGKSLEELGELIAVCARIQIQGFYATDPATGLSNRVRLECEMGDVLAQIECNLNHLPVDRAAVMARRRHKVEQMAQWEELLRVNKTLGA